MLKNLVNHVFWFKSEVYFVWSNKFSKNSSVTSFRNQNEVLMACRLIDNT